MDNMDLREMFKKHFFAFAIADGMFPSNAIVHRREVSIDEARQYLASGKVISCLNASHGATVVAMKQLGLEVDIPDTPQKIAMREGDEILVMSVRNLPRLTENRHYTDKEIKKASFVFGLWSVGDVEHASVRCVIDARAAKLLEENGMRTIQDVFEKRQEDLIRITWVGRKTAGAFRDFAWRLGLRW